MSIFKKFPHTFHLMDMGGGISRSDKILSKENAEKFYTRPVIIEEKVDGANIGFSLSDSGEILVQNRGSYVTSQTHPQFSRLDEWISLHEESLFEILVSNKIIYGEWCFARHSIYYDRLPDWFLAFDVYDLDTGLFLSRNKRVDLLKGTNISQVPFIFEGHLDKSKMTSLLNRNSQLHDGVMEGIYLRIDNEQGYLVDRAKVVNAGFVQAIEEHWSKGKMVTNKINILPV